ncbi:MAG: hypothetical protein J6S75_01375 [Thermoguttaceae bacterium]|nr:hypothetical protein [Thermoguttaceae bacterium]
MAKSETTPTAPAIGPLLTLLAGIEESSGLVRPDSVPPAWRGCLRPLPPLSHTVCDCPSAPVVPVIYTPSGPMRVCPRCGIAPVAARGLSLCRVDFSAVARGLAALLGARGGGEPIADTAWPLGRRGNIPLVYLRRIEPAAAQILIRRQFARSGRTWFIVSTRRRTEFARELFGFARVLSLEELPSGLPAAEVFAAERPAGAAVKGEIPGKRPRPRRAERLVKIDKLLEYLKLYAKSLAETILRRERDGLDLEIPRRPTQRQLAAKLGMTQSDISNCLRDKSAVLLRLIWENLENPEGLIRVLGGRG